MAKSESEIQKELLAHAKKHQLIAWIDRANSGKVKVRGGFTQLHEVGTPDLIGYSIDGRMIGIEVKDVANFYKNNHGLRDEQVKRLYDMKEKGCFCGVACCISHVNEIMLMQYPGLDN